MGIKEFRSEEELKEAMGERYHVCHKCSVYNTVGARLACDGRFVLYYKVDNMTRGYVVRDGNWTNPGPAGGE